MTPMEFKKARQKLGLSTAKLGAILDVHPTTVRKWENDGGSTARPPNPIACRVLKWMQNGFDPKKYD